MWSPSEKGMLKKLTIDHSRRSREELVKFVQHFKDDGSQYSVVYRDEPVHASSEFARKIQRLTQQSKLDWIFETQDRPKKVDSALRAWNSPSFEDVTRAREAYVGRLGSRLRQAISIGQYGSALVETWHPNYGPYEIGIIRSFHEADKELADLENCFEKAMTRQEFTAAEDHFKKIGTLLERWVRI